ncbi:MAG: pyridoxamine 5'-phosphate oxidase family protein [Dehalococcoidia bacterium]
MPIALTDQMRDELASALENRVPALVASASPSGEPDIAYKGSVMVWDDEHLAFWERAHGQTRRNLEANPGACVLFRNPESRLMWKFFGTAEVLPSGPVRDAIMAKTVQAELDRDPDRKGAAVVIRVDRVIQAGQVLMEREV